VISGQRLAFEEQARPFDHNDTVSVDGRESESESESESENEMTELGMRAQSLEFLLADLYRLSFKIRNTASRANGSRALGFKQLDEESGIDLFSAYKEIDRRHIYEYFSSIRQSENVNKDLLNQDNVSLTTNVQWPALDEHTIKLLAGRPIEIFPNMEDDLFAHRVALANTHRRQRFAYWRNHTLKLSNNLDCSPGARSSRPLGENPSEVPLPSGRLLSVLDKPTLSSSNQIASTIISGTDATRFDPKIEDKLDTETIISYATTAYGLEGDAVNLPPPPPDATTQPEFLCQICHVVCPSKQGKGREWR
jgi:hypothetical protein